MDRPTVTPPDEIRRLSDAEVPDFLERTPVAVLAFVAEDDRASERFRPRLTVLSARLARPGLSFAFVDTTTDRLIAEAMGIQGLPTTVVFVDGEMTDRLLGGVPDNVLEETINLRVRL